MSLNFDPVKADVRVGIEVHQQLASSRKLFCSCPPVKSDELPLSFERRLRPSQSELGRMDPAVVFEFNKGKSNKYMWNPASACLVEADEEPPHLIEPYTLDTVLLICRMLHAKQIDEIHVMRKIVIDGSNTAGFQRTAVVGLGGSLRYAGGSVGVQSVTLEEDAARIVGEDDTNRIFALDRLGVPLVEIALDPVVGIPENVESAALELGRALRSTGRVARGLGTIRQDLNVSVMGGEVVEVKGVQKLNLVAKVVRYEAMRQMGLVKIAEEAGRRGVRNVETGISDVTRMFNDSKSAVIQKIIAGEGVVLCVSATGMAGLVGFEPYPGTRLGKELAEIARTNSLGGVIHSDEFRKQSVSEAEEKELRRGLSVNDDAALVLVAGPSERAGIVAGLLSERLKAAPDGVPRETRVATEDGETRYMRPRPGAARMYPETDIPEIVVTPEILHYVETLLPLPWDEKVKLYQQEYSLSRDMAMQVYDSGRGPLFEALAAELGLDRSVLASLLVEAPARASRDGVPEENVSAELLEDIARALDSGAFAKEGAYDVLKLVAGGRATSVAQAVDKLGIRAISDAELEVIVGEAMERHRKLIAERGGRAFSAVMGEVMRLARGRADGAKVSAMIRRRLPSAEA